MGFLLKKVHPKSSRRVLRAAVLSCLLILLGLIFRPIQTDAATGINQQINYQGRLLNAQGATVPDGTYNIQFKIYKDGDGQSAGDTTGSPAGTLLWTEKWQNSSSQGVTVKNGYFSVQLGAICALGGGSCQSTTNTGVDFNQSVLWLSVNIGGTTSGTPSYVDELLPMRQMAAAPYALNSNMLGGMTAAQFLQLAPNLVQADSTTNSSIFINKTGSSGYIIELQSASSDVFTVSKTGVITATGGLTIGSTSVCDSVGSVGCVAKSGSGFYIHNQTGTVGGGTMQSGNIALQGGSSTAPTAALAAAVGGSGDILDLQNSSGTNVVTVGNTGNVAIQPSSPSATAFLIQNAGVALFTADTSNKKIILNSQSNTNPILVVTHSDGTTAFEIRTGGTGNLNTYLGLSSGAAQTSGQANTGVGASATAGITSGSSNTGVGYGALYNTSTGTGNIALGEFGQYYNTTGSYNTALGYRAGYLDPDGFNSVNNLQNTTSIGAYSVAQASNSIVIGGTGSKAVKVGIGTTVPTNTLSVAPIQSSAGTASQSGTTITGSGTSWDTTMIGDTIVFSDGTTETITAVASTTSMTGSASQTVGSQAYRLHYPGLQVSTNGQVGIGQNTPTRPLDVAQNSTQVTLPMGLFEQSGTGDATIEFRNNNATTGGSFYVGQDTSNSNTFSINSSTAAKSSQATPTHVQSNTLAFTSGTSATSQKAFTGANTAGNLIVVATTWDPTNTQTFTCSDTAGNTYSTALVTVDNGQTQALGVCYAANIKAAAAGNNVTVTYGNSATPGFRVMSIHEYSGVATTSPLDVSTSNVAVGATGTNGYTSTAATTNQDGDLLYGVAFDDDSSPGTWTAGTSPFAYTSRSTATGWIAEDSTQTTAGSAQATFGQAATAHHYIAYMLTFKRGLSTGSLTDTNTNSLFSLSQTGGAKFQNVSNSTNAFQIQNASGTQIFNVDTSLSRISIGNGSTGSATPTLLILNSSTVAADPGSAVAGAMYYNASTGNFRCLQNGQWQNCLGGLVAVSTSVTTINTCTTACGSMATITGGWVANYCSVGHTYHIYASGTYGFTTGSPTIAMNLYLGTNAAKASDTLLGAAANAVAVPSSATSNLGWELDAYLICNSTTLVMTHGSVSFLTATTGTTITSKIAPANVATTISNTTQNIYLFPAWSASSASNTITCSQFVVQAL